MRCISECRATLYIPGKVLIIKLYACLLKGFWTEVPAYGLFCLSVSHSSLDNGESNCIFHVTHG